MDKFTRTITSNNGVFAASFALAALTYVAMIVGPLAWLEDIAGMPPFDMRPAGYNFTEAQALIAALGEGGRQIYLFHQLPLDLIYPPMLGLTLFIALTREADCLGGWLGHAFSILRWAAPLAALADYAENLMIFVMLGAGDGLDSGTVVLASAFSVAKSSLTTLAASAVLVGFAVYGVRRFRSHRT